MTHGRPSPSRSRSAPPWRPPRRGWRCVLAAPAVREAEEHGANEVEEGRLARLIQAVDDRERRRESVEVEFGEGAVAVDVNPGDLHVSSPATESRATEVASSTSRASRVVVVDDRAERPDESAGRAGDEHGRRAPAAAAGSSWTLSANARRSAAKSPRPRIASRSTIPFVRVSSGPRPTSRTVGERPRHHATPARDRRKRRAGRGRRATLHAR